MPEGTEPESVIHRIVRCFSHVGIRAWELIFTTRRIIFVRKGAKVALKMGVAGGVGGVTGPLGAAVAGNVLARSAEIARDDLDRALVLRGIDQLAQDPENVVVDLGNVQEIFLKDVLFGSPEVRIIMREGKKWTFGLYDTSRALGHFEPLRAAYGPIVRHSKKKG